MTVEADAATPQQRRTRRRAVTVGVLTLPLCAVLVSLLLPRAPAPHSAFDGVWTGGSLSDSFDLDSELANFHFYSPSPGLSHPSNLRIDPGWCYSWDIAWDGTESFEIVHEEEPEVEEFGGGVASSCTPQDQAAVIPFEIGQIVAVNSPGEGQLELVEASGAWSAELSLLAGRT